MDILHQLGELVLGSVPTILLFLLVWGLYRSLVYKPLHNVLAERRRMTTGAIEEAHLAIAAAEHKTGEYESRLRIARNGIGLDRERRIAQWNTEREQVLAAAQERAQLKVRTAKLELEQSARVAKEQIETSVESLAAEILAAVLPRGAQDAQGAAR